MTNNVKKAIRMLLAMQRHSWEQGIAMQAMYEAGEEETLIQMAYESVYRSLPDGRCAVIGVMDGATDSCAVGEGLRKAYQLCSDEYLKTGLDHLLKWTRQEAARNNQGILYHLTTGKQFWADSIYMVPTFLAASEYYQEAVTAVLGYWDKLYDSEAQLMCHMWDEKGDASEDFCDKSHWGVGNGWTLVGIGKVISALPKEEFTDKINCLVHLELELLDSILNYVRKDGLFHNIVDDPSTFVETNLSQMVAYTIYRGINDGWMPPSYLMWAELLRNAVQLCVDSVGRVHGVCGAPTFDKPGFAPEGQAFYILMEKAREDYLFKSIHQ